jgi:hypothetical protein
MPITGIRKHSWDFKRLICCTLANMEDGLHGPQVPRDLFNLCILMQAQGLPPLGPAASLELAWLNIAQLQGREG